MTDWLQHLSLDRAETGRILRAAASPPAAAPVRLDVPLGEGAHGDWLDAFAALAPAFGTRVPLGRRPRAPTAHEAPLRPLLTENLHPRQRHGYGDPAVVRQTLPDGRFRWWLAVTSNDAPDAFPLFSSDDLEAWRPEGFVFPEGATPPWCLTGEGRADFWAPELHRVGEAWWCVFSARRPDESMAVGLAVADDPAGPWRAAPEPLVGEGVIDAHLVLTPEDGAPWLLWKEDANAVWPRRLAAVFARTPALIERLFDAEADRRSAFLSARLLAVAPDLVAMEEFFAVQPLIEAAAEDLPAFRARLAVLLEDPALDPQDRVDLAEALRTTETRILARRLTPDGARLEGETRTVLVNDRLWEAHLIEGAFVFQAGERWWIVYAANDFSTDHYGIGVGVADHPLGPYEKAAEPLLRSTAAWSGPGHPSVAPDAAGRPRIFLHAFFPGRVGYNVFRALLTAGLAVKEGRLTLV